MAILYLTEQQAWVAREGDCLIVHIPERNEDGSRKGKQERKMTVPLFKVEEVMILRRHHSHNSCISKFTQRKDPGNIPEQIWAVSRQLESATHKKQHTAPGSARGACRRS